MSKVLFPNVETMASFSNVFVKTSIEHFEMFYDFTPNILGDQGG